MAIDILTICGKSLGMTHETNLIKLVVGIESVADLHERNRFYLEEYEGRLAIPVHTRHGPKKEKELLNGGSLYRVIKGRIQCRQAIIGFDRYEDESGISRCRIMVDPEMILTTAAPQRPFQGWRYLPGEKCPADKGVFDPDNTEQDLPDDMRDELEELGLL
jgi:hypothetical protein